MALTPEQEYELLTLEREKHFAETQGGAALGNPNIQKQGDKSKRDFGGMEPWLDIAGAGALGGVFGAASKEILGGAGNVIGALPYPVAQTIGNALKASSQIVGAGGRIAPTIAGVISGVGSETAGQTAEALGAGTAVAEGARVAGGFTGAGTAAAGGKLIKAYLLTPALSFFSKARKMAIKELVTKIDAEGMQSLSDKERAALRKYSEEIRGEAKSDESLKAVADAMDAYASDRLLVSTQALGNAEMRARSLGSVAPVPQATLSDTGEGLRKVITGRHGKSIAENRALFAQNEAARDEIVSAKEKAKAFVSDTPEYKQIIKSIQSQLDNTEAMKRSPDVQRGLEKILKELTNPEVTDPTKALVLEGQNLNWNVTPGQPKPVSFQAIDDFRRKLGEVFRGKPPEGYDAISADHARKYYAELSELQKAFAGGKGGPQEKLLDDYARGKEGLESFISARGRKATALDRYNDKEFVTDASTLPTTYFKSRASVRALKELTGDEAAVNKAAMEYINTSLEGADAAAANKFMVKNRDWLQEVPRARQLIERYAASADVAERGVRQATAFVKEVQAGNAAMSGGRFPADKVRNLVESGNADLWGIAGPAIASSPQGKDNILKAVRQILADKPMSVDKFNRTVRPALINSGLADDAAMDLIAKKLDDIGAMRIPEREKLSLRNRIILNSIAGYTASGIARGAVEAAKMVPE